MFDVSFSPDRFCTQERERRGARRKRTELTSLDVINSFKVPNSPKGPVVGDPQKRLSRDVKVNEVLSLTPPLPPPEALPVSHHPGVPPLVGVHLLPYEKSRVDGPEQHW